MQTHSSKAFTGPSPEIAPFIMQFQKGLLGQVASSLPLLTQLTQYYIRQPSKRMRPHMIFLMCQATNGLGSDWHVKLLEAQASALDSQSEGVFSEDVLPSQINLAQAIEMIHVASLLHDDVIDNAETRRGTPSAPAAFGNNHTILGGDFLLGRAMALAASLRSPEVMILVSQAVCTLVEGELLQSGAIDKLQSRGNALEAMVLQRILQTHPDDTELAKLWEDYLRKTYMKTASLFAHALQSAVILGGVNGDQRWRAVAASYGERLGIAFQLMDDLLDFEGDPDKLGKPANADLNLGLATAPVLFALQEDHDLRPLVLRRFKHAGDVEEAVECVRSTRALARTRELAELYAEKAREAISPLPHSVAKDGLMHLTAAVLMRQN
ncbi:terpenoid synthase [Trametes coccinea BRFM310]|uniref:(2E,6E)-farnesyl diphosphate synthase n=1 Tax=Trametes coccinea (strain BRFM310) TaxID=1353009 RepID=A0A1Y2IMI1_TRAC3|nr:terpenoid synthase [Trametes coccinea BRFM310]